MTIRNPVGRVNYEPNTWDNGGPREDPTRGFRSFLEEAMGPKVRLRPESFADHYSQARLFYVSQTPIEQKHISDALVFELSKVERPDIRSRVVSHLVNIHADLAAAVAEGLGLELPQAAAAARPTREDLAPSQALSIVLRGPKRFEGRKLGVVLTDGADAKLFTSLAAKIEKLGGVVEVIAPKIAGVTLSDRSAVPAQQKIDGGPSVLYDAVAVIASEEGAALLAKDATAKGFVADAFAHCKFIGYSEEAQPLLLKAGVGKDDLDAGCFLLSKGGIESFVRALADLRFWEREQNADLDALQPRIVSV